VPAQQMQGPEFKTKQNKTKQNKTKQNKTKLTCSMVYSAAKE
jgi:hypothetical protein